MLLQWTASSHNPPPNAVHPPGSWSWAPHSPSFAPGSVNGISRHQLAADHIGLGENTAASQGHPSPASLRGSFRDTASQRRPIVELAKSTLPNSSIYQRPTSPIPNMNSAVWCNCHDQLLYSNQQGETWSDDDRKCIKRRHQRRAITSTHNNHSLQQGQGNQFYEQRDIMFTSSGSKPPGTPAKSSCSGVSTMAAVRSVTNNEKEDSRSRLLPHIAQSSSPYYYYSHPYHGNSHSRQSYLESASTPIRAPLTRSVSHGRGLDVLQQLRDVNDGATNDNSRPCIAGQSLTNDEWR